MLCNHLVYALISIRVVRLSTAVHALVQVQVEVGEVSRTTHARRTCLVVKWLRHHTVRQPIVHLLLLSVVLVVSCHVACDQEGSLRACNVQGKALPADLIVVESRVAVLVVGVAQLGVGVEGIACRADVEGLGLAQILGTVVDETCRATDAFVEGPIEEVASRACFLSLAPLSHYVEGVASWTNDLFAHLGGFVIAVSGCAVEPA